MTNSEYDQADNELFAMMNGGTPTGKKTVGVVVSDKLAKDMEYLEELIFQCQDLIPIAGWFAATVVFVAAMAFGWMHMLFGAIVALFTFARFIYSIWRFLRGC